MKKVFLILIAFSMLLCCMSCGKTNSSDASSESSVSASSTEEESSSGADADTSSKTSVPTTSEQSGTSTTSGKNADITASTTAASITTTTAKGGKLTVMTNEDGSGPVPLGSPATTLKQALKANGISLEKSTDTSLYTQGNEDGSYLGRDGEIYYITKYAVYVFGDPTLVEFPNLDDDQEQLPYLVYVFITDKNYTTARGVKLGDTVERVLSLYGSEYENEGDPEAYIYYDNQTALTFNTVGGIVEEIVIYKAP